MTEGDIMTVKKTSASRNVTRHTGRKATSATSATKRAVGAKLQRGVKKASVRTHYSKLKSENSELKAMNARLEATIAEMSAAIANLSSGVYHEEHKGNHHEAHEELEGILKPVPPAHQRSNENTKDTKNLRDLRGKTEPLAPHPSSLDPRVKLNAPMILSVMGTANSFTLTWGAVAGA
jgi:predicted RNase H-like nuclease (RuvC/YqgF family)